VAAGSRRVIAGVSGSLRSLGALRWRGRSPRSRGRAGGRARLGSRPWEVAYRRVPCPLLLKLWEQAACQRLRDAFDDAFGGVPCGVAVRQLVVRAAPSPALVELADRRDDLLVVGYGGGAGWDMRSTAPSPATASRTPAARC
jgi:hypothetical protein